MTPPLSPSNAPRHRLDTWRRISRIDWSFGVPVVVLATLIGLYLHMQPSALDSGTFTSNLNDALPLILVCAAQTIVIIGGGIDISVGGVISLVNVIAATHLTGTSTSSLLLWSVLLLLLGVSVGALNGLLIGLADLSPVIVTIATWSICGGIALFILGSPGGAVGQTYIDFWTATSFGWPHALVAVIVLFLAWSIFRRTRTGMSLYALGSDQEATRLTGVSVWRTRFLSYTLSGGLSALAGLFLAANTGTGDPTVGPPFILNSIAAVVIGGTPITGGRGGVTRSILGASIFIVIADVIFAANVSSYLTPLVTGLVLLAVVAINAIGPLLRRFGEARG